MRERGWSEEAIALEIDEATRLAQPGFIWPDNWPTAQVFERCNWTVLMGMHKPHYAGIAASEIEAVCRVLRIAAAERPRVFDGVRLMASAAAPILNERHD